MALHPLPDHWPSTSLGFLQVLDKRVFWRGHVGYLPLRWSFPSTSGTVHEAFLNNASRAHMAIENLSPAFKAENAGKFILMSGEGRILAMGNSIAEINRKMKESGSKEHGQLEIIGQKVLAKTRR